MFQGIQKYLVLFLLLLNFFLTIFLIFLLKVNFIFFIKFFFLILAELVFISIRNSELFKV